MVMEIFPSISVWAHISQSKRHSLDFVAQNDKPMIRFKDLHGSENNSAISWLSLPVSKLLNWIWFSLQDFVSNFKLLSCDKLSSSHTAFTVAISSKFDLLSYVVKFPQSKEAMQVEIWALTNNYTWTANLPPEKICYTKLNIEPSWSIESYKARLVAKGYAQQEGLDHESLSRVAMTIVRCILAISAVQNWHLVYMLIMHSSMEFEQKSLYWTTYGVS